MTKKLINVLVVLAVAAAGLSAQPRMSHEEAMQKADELISRLTLQEKCDMTHGYQKFFLPGVPEKGIPYVYVADASTGFRISKTIPREVHASLQASPWLQLSIRKSLMTMLRPLVKNSVW